MPRPKPVPRPNALRNIRAIRSPTPLSLTAASRASVPPVSAPVPPPAPSARRPAHQTCPNKECEFSMIEDGVCHTCGTVVDDSNIVAEVQFGETSTGAAVVQGAYVGADQAGARNMGPGGGFRRGGEGSDREATIREGKRLMQAMGNALKIQDSTVTSGVQIFKMAAMANFIQGRRMDMVAAVSLYSACRKEKPCRVMLIDFADRTQVNVFKLGRTFKALHSEITLSKDGLQPVLPEDLIYRFAQKLEFGLQTAKVAGDAVRLVQRMSLDWIVMGRRPSGVCGACLIMAARMNNFRRTVTEVVYIVKVTTSTIQKRLDEFKQLPSSALTVEEFLTNTFLESAHDPPAFYEKTEEYQRMLRATKRRKKRPADEPRDGDRAQSEATDGMFVPGESAHSVRPEEVRRDADGFVVPPTPNRATVGTVPNDHFMSNIDPAIMVEPPINGTEQTASSTAEPPAEETSETFHRLVDEFGALLPENLDEPLTERVARPRRTLKEALASIPIPPEWPALEAELDAQIDELVSDPHTSEHALQYALAGKRARYNVMVEETIRPPLDVCMDAEIGEDEFADDPEVANCLLAPADVAKKEKVWVNENKEWLARQQHKEFQRRQALKGPAKVTRRRVKKPRIGEGQHSAASSPAEAAISAMKARSFSKKINYDALATMFENVPGSSRQANGERALGSAATSRVTSRAGSSVAESEAGDDGLVADTASLTGGDASRVVGGLVPGRQPPKRKRGERLQGPTPTPTAERSASENRDDGEVDEEEEEDDDDDDEEGDSHTATSKARKGTNGTAVEVIDDDDEDDDDDDPEDDGIEDWKKGLGAGLGLDDDQDGIGGGGDSLLDGDDYGLGAEEEEDYGGGFGDEADDPLMG